MTDIGKQTIGGTNASRWTSYIPVYSWWYGTNIAAATPSPSSPEKSEQSGAPTRRWFPSFWGKPTEATKNSKSAAEGKSTPTPQGSQPGKTEPAPSTAQSVFKDTRGGWNPMRTVTNYTGVNPDHDLGKHNPNAETTLHGFGTLLSKINDDASNETAKLASNALADTFRSQTSAITGGTWTDTNDETQQWSLTEAERREIFDKFVYPNMTKSNAQTIQSAWGSECISKANQVTKKDSGWSKTSWARQTVHEDEMAKLRTELTKLQNEMATLKSEIAATSITVKTVAAPSSV